MTIFKRIAFCAFFCFLFATSFAQQKKEFPHTRVLFIFDASFSMSGIWESKTRMDVAKSILIPFVDSLCKIPNVELALRVYGNRSPFPPQDCNDTHLEVPFSIGNEGAIIDTILNLKPNGTTPIAHSLALSAYDFPKDSLCRNIIFLLTDGVEACDGDPCMVSKELQKQGVILNPFIIGVGNEVDFNKVFGCAGQVYQAKSETEFLSVLNEAMKKALTSTPLQVHLLDTYKKPRETNVPMTFYDINSRHIKYNFTHSLIQTGEPDIIFIDPLVKYKIKVHTIPPVFSDTVNLEKGQHTIVKIDAPQGSIKIQSPPDSYGTKIPAIVRQAGKMETLHVQYTEASTKYITGKYDVEALTLPRTYFYDVDVKQSETTVLKIPKSGRVTFTRSEPYGYGAIYIDRNTDLELVLELPAISHSTEVYNLQPGRYVVIWREKKETDTEKSISKRFEVKSGGSNYIQLKYEK